MNIAEMVSRLAALGATPEMIAVAVEAVSTEQQATAAERRKDEERRAKRAEQKKNERSRATVARQGSDKGATVAATLPPNGPPNDKSNPPLNPPPDTPPVSTETGAPAPKKARSRALPGDWQPGERSEKTRRDLGRSVEWMNSTATDMRVWAESKGELRADWDATHDGWMRREAKREGEKPLPRGSPSGGRDSGMLAVLKESLRQYQ